MGNTKQSNTGKFAATLTLVEIGLGSLLHSFKVPLSGHFLSLNQIALLARASFQLQSKKAALEISAISSLLKSLSPAGKKLTPMLAIAAQGLLFYLGLLLGGLNFLGLIIGSILSSAWAFIQPVMFIFLLYGKTTIDVAEYFLKEVEKLIPHADQFLLFLVIALFILKCLAAIVLSILIIRMKEEAYQQFQQKMVLNIKAPHHARQLPAWRMALTDLMGPLFIVSFLMTAFFFLYSQSDKAEMIWALIRPLALGYLFFYAVRVWPVEKTSGWLRSKGHTRFADNLDVAIEMIKKR